MVSRSPPNVHSSAGSADHMKGAPRKSGEPAEGEGPIPAPQRSLQERLRKAAGRLASMRDFS